jgi:hypothetical protein
VALIGNGLTAFSGRLSQIEDYVTRVGWFVENCVTVATKLRDPAEQLDEPTVGPLIVEMSVRDLFVLGNALPSLGRTRLRYV